MQIYRLAEQPVFDGGDGTVLRELFHPDHDSVDVRYSLAHATLAKGEKTLLHRLKTVEVYYILAGHGKMHIEDDVQDVFPEEVVYIPAHTVQWIENVGTSDLVFLCLVDPAWKVEDEEILPS